MMKKIFFPLFPVLLTIQMMTQIFGMEASENPKVVAVINQRNFGEQSQVRGVCAAMSQRLPHVQAQEISADEIDQLKGACQGQEKIIFVTSGVDGAKVVNVLAAQNFPHTAYVHTNHMVLPEHATLLTEAQFVALPKHAITDEFLKKTDGKFY